LLRHEIPKFVLAATEMHTPWPSSSLSSRPSASRRSVAGRAIVLNVPDTKPSLPSRTTGKAWQSDGPRRAGSPVRRYSPGAFAGGTATAPGRTVKPRSVIFSRSILD
jgi:hypothetical protein